MGGSKGIGSRQRSEAATITCSTNQAKSIISCLHELSTISSKLTSTHTHSHAHAQACVHPPTHAHMVSFMSLRRYSSNNIRRWKSNGRSTVQKPELEYFLSPHQAESQSQLHLQQFPSKESVETEYLTEFVGIHSDWMSGVGWILVNFWDKVLLLLLRLIPAVHKRV